MTAPGRRVVYVTPSLPLSSPLHAGGLLQRDVTDSLSRQGAEVVVVAPAYRSSLEVMDEIVPGCTVMMPELLLRRNSLRGIMVRLSHRFNARVARSPLQMVHLPFLVALLVQPRLWTILRSADVIDLQWFAPIRLLPLLRLVAGRHPVIVGTFHDVVSQRLERAAAVEEDPVRRVRFTTAVTRARRLERKLGRGLTRSVVLSEKDRGLLQSVGVPQERITVLAPRIEAPGGAPETEDSKDGSATVIFVGYLLRMENHEAALWLIREIWPRVRGEVAWARLRIVGGGAKPELEKEVAASDGSIELAGFVDDLWAEYRAAGCSVVPLQDGAGVKFKTIESLIAAVPTVATPIGAEGVGTEEDFVEVSEDPALLAAGIVRALTDPVERRHARRVSERLCSQHSMTTFDRTVADIYGL